MNHEMFSRSLGCVLLVTACGAAAQQSDDPLLPPNAKAGECYARVFVPPTYQSRDERVLVQPAVKLVQYSEPRYEWVEEQILVKPVHEELRVVPAKMDWVQEKVLVKEAGEVLRYLPPEYEWMEEQVLVRPAYTTWKKGRGLIERLDEATGEIMCRVEVPAEYKTVKKRVLKTPGRTEKVVIPAEYRDVKKQVVLTAAKTEAVIVPAKFTTVRVKKLVAASEAKESMVPDRFQTVTKTEKVSDGRMEWRSVLCETNAGPGMIEGIQRALHSRGFDPGPIDGVLGHQTMSAVERFQEREGLPAGRLTMDTLSKLGVSSRI